jgi:hypothetical protein
MDTKINFDKLNGCSPVVVDSDKRQNPDAWLMNKEALQKQSDKALLSLADKKYLVDKRRNVRKLFETG